MLASLNLVSSPCRRALGLCQNPAELSQYHLLHKPRSDQLVLRSENPRTLIYQDAGLRLTLMAYLLFPVFYVLWPMILGLVLVLRIEPQALHVQTCVLPVMPLPSVGSSAEITWAAALCV